MKKAVHSKKVVNSNILVNSCNAINSKKEDYTNTAFDSNKVELHKRRSQLEQSGQLDQSGRRMEAFMKERKKEYA